MFNHDPKVSIKDERTKEVFQRIVPMVPSTCYSNLSLRECFEDEYGVIIAVIDGGLNGSGNWSAYLQDLSKLLAVMENEFSSAYVINIDNDCPDDVFEAHIAINT